MPRLTPMYVPRALPSSQPPVVERVEQIHATASTALVRVVFSSAAPGAAGARLVVSTGAALHHAAALPAGPGAPPTAPLAFPLALAAADAAVAYALELPGGGVVPLPMPGASGLRRLLDEERTARYASE